MILLIIGLGTQMTRWPPLLIDGLLARGFRVVRLGNRDIGLSTHVDDAPMPLAYTLTDMAPDTVGLMDAAGIDRGHLVGARWAA